MLQLVAAGRRSTGSGNTFLGASTGSNLGSGNNNVFVGYNACNSYTSISNALCIGANGNNLITGNFTEGTISLGQTNNGSVQVLNDLSVAATSTLQGNLAVLGASTLSGTLDVSGTLTSSSDLYVRGTLYMWTETSRKLCYIFNICKYFKHSNQYN